MTRGCNLIAIYLLAVLIMTYCHDINATLERARVAHLFQFQRTLTDLSPL